MKAAHLNIVTLTWFKCVCMCVCRRNGDDFRICYIVCDRGLKDIQVTVRTIYWKQYIMTRRISNLTQIAFDRYRVYEHLGHFHSR